jgi:hypothetical protein
MTDSNRHSGGMQCIMMTWHPRGHGSNLNCQYLRSMMDGMMQSGLSIRWCMIYGTMIS